MDVSTNISATKSLTPTAKNLLLFGIVFTIVGSVLLALGLYSFATTKAFVSRAFTVQGRIVGLKEVRVRGTGSSRSRIEIYPQVEFALLSGEVVVFASDDFYMRPRPIIMTTPEYAVGNVVDVLYDPAAPTKAKINSFSSLWYKAVMFTIFGLFFALLGIGLNFESFKLRKKELMKKNQASVLP
jgi:hypothetical protein